jgi:UDP-N-acetylmuramate--alanine ligase
MITKHKHIHLIGIGGAGLSAIARVLLERGYEVSGSDRALSTQAEELAAAGARVFAGHQASNIEGADVVVRSSAVADSNVEVQAALAAGIQVLKRAQFLGQLLADHQLIAVAGTHGKTTTTAMLAWILASLGADPSYIIGGAAKNLSANAHAGQGPAFVIEADEYDRMFLGLDPDVILVTYLEHDHPDCFPTLESYRQAFLEFVGRLRPGGILLVARDNEEAYRLFRAAGRPAAASDQVTRTYGTTPGADYRAENITRNARGGFDYDAFWLTDEGNRVYLVRVSLQVPGEHNVRNSLGALAALHAAARLLHLPPDAIQRAGEALGQFQGTGRRFDLLGEAGGVTVVDDYAHHPTEIRATLAGARARYPQARIWAVWQPHTYSRTLALLPEFAQAFGDADHVLVTEVYAARETADQFNQFSAAQVVQQMSDHPAAEFTATLEDATQALLRQLQPGDVLLTLSAGDAGGENGIGARVFARLQERTE